jgi:hypothetical protein
MFISGACGKCADNKSLLFLLIFLNGESNLIIITNFEMRGHVRPDIHYFQNIHKKI